jgi:hypothetical protein
LPAVRKSADVLLSALREDGYLLDQLRADWSGEVP